MISVLEHGTGAVQSEFSLYSIVDNGSNHATRSTSLDSNRGSAPFPRRVEEISTLVIAAMSEAFGFQFANGGPTSRAMGVD